MTGPADSSNGHQLPANLRDRLVLLVRRLRAAGVRSSPGDAITALAALEHVDLGDVAEVRAALRTVLAHRREDLPLVDRALDAFLWGDPIPFDATGRPGALGTGFGPGSWPNPVVPDGLVDGDEIGQGQGNGQGMATAEREGQRAPQERQQLQERQQEGERPRQGDGEGAGHGQGHGQEDGEEAGQGSGEGRAEPPWQQGGDEQTGVDTALEIILGAAQGLSRQDRPLGHDGPTDADEPGTWTARAGGSPGGYSPLAVLTRRDVQLLDARERQAVMAAARLLGRWLATRPSRRFVRARKGAIDGRRALREAARRAGDLTRWPRRRRRRERLRLVCLLDVSGSMDVYSQLFLHFLHGLQHAGGRVETFAIGTRLTRLTPVLLTPRPEVAMARAAAVTVDWSGGTRLGECLWVFLQRYGSLLDRETVMLVVSDGLDRGDLDLLDRTLRACRRRVRALVWMNPLAGDPRYEPRAQGMQVALPYIDVLAPAHNVESLVRLADLLARQPRVVGRHGRRPFRWLGLAPAGARDDGVQEGHR
ncbi:VWA containing CoxE family protein [Thermaerobacter marianensis DSM 12885]|uniref:VWA containing CoxE family protein n=1 Tax=Thermaerobacter marianensis (strain ATCC 700841 / DSM 12885 / JCM 10246 / 7p75a) TaxID=644966 RepID=E6SGR2_THEM7|nr:VWA domain-containing protein [Thermaerobacter marianensis]ADU51646.1 VWA containing CoxE family protein [Thermaerobacter marianensis DSM 12885]